MTWQSQFVWLDVISNALTVFVYVSMSFLLLNVVGKRRKPPATWMFLGFGALILVTLWQPFYRIEGLFKAVSALACITTAICLWRLLPAPVKIPNEAKLREPNQLLEAESLARKAVEATLQVGPNELKDRAFEKTIEVSTVKEELRKLIREELYTSNLLREREQQVTEAFEAARVGTWKWEIVSGAIKWDPQIKKLYGLSPDTSVTHVDQGFAMLHPDDREPVRLAMQRAIDGLSDFSSDFRVIHPDGSAHWIYGCGALLLGPDGKPVGMTGINMDIAARKEAETALRETERQFETLADTIPQLAWMADPDGFIFWYNRRWYEYTNTTPKQMEGWGWQSVHDPRELPQVLERWTASISTGAPFEMEFPLRGGDGLFKWFLTRCTPVLDSEGRVTRWFGTNTNVAAIRETREVLRDSERELRLLADAMPQIVWLATAAGAGRFYNERCYEYLGATFEQMENGAWSSAIHPDDLAHYHKQKTRGLANGQPYQVEFRLRRKSDGIYRWHLGRGVPTFDSSGLIANWVKTCTDIDDYKKAEESNLRFNDELENRVRLRTSELESANVELKIFSRKLEESNRDLQDFASVAAHDLQEPLRKVQAFGDRLKRSLGATADDQARDFLDRMLTATSRMQTLIHDLALFSQVNSQTHPAERVALTRIAQEVLYDLEERIAATGAVVQLEELPIIEADPTQMRQLLQNLVENSLKFHTPGKPPRVRIHGALASASRSSDVMCQLVVEDDGIGFDEKYLDRIFTIFQRLHTRAEFEGTGIGLAICRKIAHRHGGEITASSAPNEGATFTVTLPSSASTLVRQAAVFPQAMRVAENDFQSAGSSAVSGLVTYE